MEKKTYTVTETAGPFVAGRRSLGAGKTIELTEAEARYPLLNGEIAPAETERRRSKASAAVPPGQD